jgi:hypothetical protein
MAATNRGVLRIKTHDRAAHNAELAVSDIYVNSIA